MRIATLCFSKTVGGLELATLRWGAELRSHGHHVVAVLPDAPELLRYAENLGMTADRITPTLPYLDLPAARKLSAVLAREEIDLVLVGRTRDLSTAMLAAGRDVAVVLYQQMQSGLDKRDWFHNKVFKRLDGCVTITGRGRDELIEYTALAAEKIAVVPPGVDPQRFSPDPEARALAREAYGIPGDGFAVGIIGGFNPGKGQREFLEGLRAAAAMDAELGAKLYGVLVGERSGDQGEYTAELRSIREALPFADRVQFHPFASDPCQAFRALDLFVLASHSETFGMVLQEALMTGVPAIGTESGGVPEIITHEETGLLVPPKDPQAIGEAIVRLYRDPDLRCRMAGAGRSFAMRAYDPRQQYQAFEELLETSLARRKSR